MTSRCAAAGGACVDGVCEIANVEEELTTCPDGMACRVLCTNGERPCRDGVSCLGATACDVQCLGYRACQFGVDCAGAACAVTCNGDEACEDGIDVAPDGTCTSHCCGLDACAAGVGTCTTDAVCS